MFLLSLSWLVLALALQGSANTFKHKISGIKAANDEYAQGHRLKALASVPTKAGFPSSTGRVAAASIDAATSAAATSFQLYTDDTLPEPDPDGGCANALTASIACNVTILNMASNPFFDATSLDAVCTDTCKTSIASYRSSVVSACANYMIAGPNNISYTPILAIDSLSGPYYLGCEKDSSTGQYCNAVLQSFGAPPAQGILGYPQNELCTSCLLGALNLTLSNALTFDLVTYSVLQSALGECGPAWSSYNVTSPPSTTSIYVPGPSATSIGSNSTSSTWCSLLGHNITTSGNQTCAALADMYSVSWFDIVYNNPTLSSANCTSGILPDAELCLPQACATYTPTANQTCTDVIDAIGSNITVAQLISFNPNLGAGCGNIASVYEEQICVSPHGGFPSVGNGGGAVVPSSTPTAKADPPGPTVSGTTSDCGTWYQVQPNDVCFRVALNNSITLDEFLLLNPEVNVNCTNLWAGYNYCVAPYPPLATVSAPTTTITGTMVTFGTLPIPSATLMPTPVIFQTAHLPPPPNVAPGTIENGCDYYYFVKNGDNCTGVESRWGVLSEDFELWNNNPAVPCPSLVANTSVCVLVTDPLAALPPVPSNAAGGSGPDGCARWYTIVSDDLCPSVEAQFNLTQAEFFTLNPELNSGCTNLGLGEAYCVQAPPGTMPTGSPTTSPTAGPTPTDIEPGSWSNCTTYYDIRAGDSCNTIEARFNIAFTDLLRWNPEIDAACDNLALASYCVEGSDQCSQIYTVVSGDFCSRIESNVGLTDAQLRALNPWIDANCALQVGQNLCLAASTTTTSAAPAPTNIESGSWTNCTAYYTVQSGDSCNAIDATFNISFSDFLRWNPEVSTTCSNLDLAAYCVRGSNPCRNLYTVASGDFCSRIESNEGISDAELRALNPWLSSNCDLQVGQNLCIS